MSNKRIIDMQQKQILRLYVRGYSVRKISRELCIHRKSVRGYIDRYKTRNIKAAELIKPQTELTGSLSLEPPVKEDYSLSL